MDNLDKALLGAIGENMTATQLLLRGWNAINANLSIPNCKSFDIVCIHPDYKQSALVQVKTSVGKSFPVNVTIDEARNIDKLKEKIVGPYVFVYVYGDSANPSFKYFILSPTQVIMLLKASHDWYIDSWDRGDRQIKLNSPAALSLKWLQGDGGKENKRHPAFNNPLTESSENRWDNIWKD